MRFLRPRAATAFAVFLILGSALAVEIPAFTPNVVDPEGYLDESGKQSVDAELQSIRDTSGVMGAVFIVGTLDGEPIENLAVEAFRKWQLGQQGIDNGLLLVLAMKDRKSRFEVGYGLEGSITDVVALRALDAYLAPKMREGDTAGAIVDAFGFLSRIVAQDPDAVRELDESPAEDAFDWTLGLSAWGVLLFALWFCLPIRNRWVGYRRAELKKLDPSLSLDDEDIVRSTGFSTRSNGSLFIECFLSVNPGIFVLLLSAWSVEAFLICVGGTLLIMLLVILLSARRYGSLERYRRFLDRLARRRAAMIQAGDLEEKAPGVFSYTPAYYASRASSSSSSSSSSRSSSSSGGGSSGGGGASSGW